MGSRRRENNGHDSDGDLLLDYLEEQCPKRRFYQQIDFSASYRLYLSGLVDARSQLFLPIEALIIE